MQGLKGVIIVASIVATAAAVGACRGKHVKHEPMKLGFDMTVEQAVRA